MFGDDATCVTLQPAALKCLIIESSLHADTLLSLLVPAFLGCSMMDGPGRYRLLAIISHMGSNTACGHYVSHIRKGGRWVIYNDEKVAASEHPPKSLGYLYLYERVDEDNGQAAA